MIITSTKAQDEDHALNPSCACSTRAVPMTVEDLARYVRHA
jgi:hypothetical protein